MSYVIVLLPKPRGWFNDLPWAAYLTGASQPCALFTSLADALAWRAKVQAHPELLGEEHGGVRI